MKRPRMRRRPETILIQDAPVVRGRGRGRNIGFPTINVKPATIPDSVRRGIYACYITMDGTEHPGALHYGPRPAFNDTETMEIHVIDQNIEHVPSTVNIELVQYIRPVQDYPDVQALQNAIERDINAARGILQAHA